MEKVTRSNAEKFQMALVILIIAMILSGSLFFSGVI